MENTPKVKMKILIAEDNPKMREKIKKLFTDSLDIYECINGKEAVEKYFEIKPTFVLMDINMEIMDGLTATREIIKRCPGAKIAIVTNYTEKEFREEAQNAGAIAYVLKDNLSELKQIIINN